jgi:predicted ferric reductase
MKPFLLAPLLLAGFVLGGVVAAGAPTPPDVGVTTGEMGSEHVWWYMGRASGFVAYWMLFASLALGLAVSSRFFDGLLARPWVYEMHQFLSLVVLIAMLAHALVMLPDPYAKFTLQELLIPMQARYRPEALAVGIVTLYGSVIVSASFYLKKYIGQKGWRLLHYATFALFVTAMLHGLFAGTDSKQQWVQFMYLGSGLAVLFLTFFRILASRRAAAPKRRETPPPAVAPPAVAEGANS